MRSLSQILSSSTVLAVDLDLVHFWIKGLGGWVVSMRVFELCFYHGSLPIGNGDEIFFSKKIPKKTATGGQHLKRQSPTPAVFWSR